MPKPKILLVDDNPFFLDLEKGFLEKSRTTILEAHNGAEALIIARSSRPDLIYMDLDMPVMDGLQCCLELKKDPSLATIPVVIIYNPERSGDRERIRVAQCDGSIAKPLLRKSFLETGRRFLEQIDRRLFRVPCHTSVFFRMKDQGFYGKTLDISAGGVFVGFQGKVQTETPLHLHLLLPEPFAKVVEARGRIAWVNQGPSLKKPFLPNGFGVEFIAISEDCSGEIKEYVGQFN